MHYGHDLDELETRTLRSDLAQRESDEQLKSLGRFMDFVDNTKKVRITFDMTRTTR